MKQYNIEYSREAKQDLIDIKKYIKYNLQEPLIAERLILKIKAEIDKLQTFPKMFSIIDNNFIKKLEIRKFNVDNYIVFYRINDSNIQIVRIMYCRRNWTDLL